MADREIVATYEYRDAEGALVAEKVRFEPKGFSWRMPGSDDFGLVGVAERDLPLYNLDKIMANPKAKVIFVEGEKSADALWAAGILATCLPGGAATKPSVAQVLPLKGRSVGLWPDKDSMGRALMRRVYDRLRNIALEIRAVYPKEIPAKGDAFDWLQQGYSKLDLASEWEANNMGILVDRELSVVNLADVEPSEVRWLWRKYLPSNMLVMLEGQKGVGKSWFTLQLASQVSNGEVPGADKKPLDLGEGKVLILAHEDPLAEVTVTRLKQMGAKRENITAISSVVDAETGEEEWIDLRKDLPTIEAYLSQDDYRLLIIDPINNYLDPNVDTYRDSSMRAVLSPLADMAQRLNVCVIGIRHLKKSREGDMLDWGVGSIAYGAVARVVLTLVHNPFEQGERLLVPTATNLTSTPWVQAFRIANEEEGGKEEARFEWLGSRSYTKDEVMDKMREELKGSAKKREQQIVEEFNQAIQEPKALTPRQLAERLKVSTSHVVRMLYDVGPDAYVGLDDPIRTELIEADLEKF